MMTQQLFLLFCGLACIGFSASAVSIRQGPAWLTGWLLALVLIRPGQLDLELSLQLTVEAQQIALTCALLAGLFILQPHRRWLATGVGGFMGFVWSLTAMSAGAPTAASLMIPAGCGLGTLLTSCYRRGFNSPHLREEAHIVILLAALIVALVPDILNGWRSAVTLQGGNSMPGSLAGSGTFFIAATLLVCGALYANWKHKR